MVGDSSPGVTARRLEQNRARAVVVEHEILLAANHALHAGDELVAAAAIGSPVSSLRSGPPPNHTTVRRMHQIVQTQSPARADDIGDGIGDAELHGDLHRAVQPDHRGVDAVACQILETRLG